MNPSLLIIFYENTLCTPRSVIPFDHMQSRAIQEETLPKYSQDKVGIFFILYRYDLLFRSFLTNELLIPDSL